MEIKEILLSKKYCGKTKRQIRELEKWIKEDSFNGKPDGRDFPMHKKGDLILILNAESLYTPEIDSWPHSTNHVSRHPFENVGFLKNTIAQVIGYSDIPYYDPWEADMKINCIDEKVRFIDASTFEERPNFIFVPHPESLEKFEHFMQYYVGEQKNKVKMLLEKVYVTK